MNNVQLTMLQKIVLLANTHKFLLKTCVLREKLITRKLRKFEASGTNLTHVLQFLLSYWKSMVSRVESTKVPFMIHLVLFCHVLKHGKASILHGKFSYKEILLLL